MTIYVLDMGLRQYGDCILITHGDKKILIDCGKPVDKSSIRLQLKKILQQEPPFHFDLLIMTHCHDDHIGSLPELIEMDEISAGRYLLADPDLRWKKPTDTDGANEKDGITEALFEEDYSNLSDSELELFLSDVDTIDVRYRRMISTLTARGANVKLFEGVDADNYDDLHNEFKDFGLKIMGPTRNHLQITRNGVLGAREAVADFFEQSDNTDTIESMVELYRKIFNDGTIDSQAFLDATKNSGSINNQSIVVKVSADGLTALLAGDMQFAEPNVVGIQQEMDLLLEKVFEEGPYTLIKTCHHTSENGLSDPMLDRWISEGTEFFVHSGGLRDDDHPDEKVLKSLKARKNSIKFARTDRNGMIKIEKGNSGDLVMSITKGTINNFDVNVEPDGTGPQDEPIIAEEAPVTEGVIPVVKEVENIMIPQQTSSGDQGFVELVAKIPANISKVTITVEIDGEKKKL
ncbi:MBL fold metallo-hydrolase [Dyadobacter sp. 3J3]|uniref:MBL fold metallo-hydrolase n=1 Tax=Dyadobacter sp. 3J3 TaxID=2606600 RepID=UPI0013575B4E|nr:MBL fold metallo-hydrolase [Dyadobacter sp. 3J3]